MLEIKVFCRCWYSLPLNQRHYIEFALNEQCSGCIDQLREEMGVGLLENYIFSEFPVVKRGFFCVYFLAGKHFCTIFTSCFQGGTKKKKFPMHIAA